MMLFVLPFVAVWLDLSSNGPISATLSEETYYWRTPMRIKSNSRKEEDFQVEAAKNYEKSVNLMWQDQKRHLLLFAL